MYCSYVVVLVWAHVWGRMHDDMTRPATDLQKKVEEVVEIAVEKRRHELYAEATAEDDEEEENKPTDPKQLARAAAEARLHLPPEIEADYHVRFGEGLGPGDSHKRWVRPQREAVGVMPPRWFCIALLVHWTCGVCVPVYLVSRGCCCAGTCQSVVSHVPTRPWQLLQAVHTLAWASGDAVLLFCQALGRGVCHHDHHLHSDVQLDGIRKRNGRTCDQRRVRTPPPPPPPPPPPYRAHLTLELFVCCDRAWCSDTCPDVTQIRRRRRNWLVLPDRGERSNHDHPARRGR